MPNMHFPKDATDVNGNFVGNCGLVAMATVAGCSVATSTKEYMKASGQRSGNWQGSTDGIYYPQVLKQLGVDFSEIFDNRFRSTRTNITLRNWVYSCMPNDGNMYFIVTTGHVQVVWKENTTFMVSDQRGPQPLENYRGKGKQVRWVLRINGNSAERYTDDHTKAQPVFKKRAKRQSNTDKIGSVYIRRGVHRNYYVKPGEYDMVKTFQAHGGTGRKRKYGEGFVTIRIPMYYKGTNDFAKFDAVRVSVYRDDIEYV